ncbi:MAG: HXXEE domain-containing protein [Ginsengibacter sp.]
MSIAELSILILVLFTLHEFEEIICVRSWILKNENNPKLKKEMFIAGKSHYSSSETLSIMIMEEFILLSGLLWAAIAFKNIEVVIAILITYTFHLFFHIFQSIQFKKWPPGSRTALIEILPVLSVLIYYFLFVPINRTNVFIWTVVFLTILISNLKLLHFIADKIEKWRKKLF